MGEDRSEGGNEDKDERRQGLLRKELEAVAASIAHAAKAIEHDERAEATGFVGYDLPALIDTVLELCRIAPPPRTVLDLGCGDGRFALLCACAGYPSFGIEINPLLIAHAERLREELGGCLAASCVFATGDLLLPEYRERYRSFLKQHNGYPTSSPNSETDEDVYATLAVSPRDAAVIYCYAWPTQSRFFFNYLNEVARRDAVFVVPAYERYTTGEHLNAMLRVANTLVLQQLSKRGAFIGVRTDDDFCGSGNEDS
jgi:SAM-dependent methyltransferase